MSTNPDDIRQQIEQTRGQLSSDVNALGETVSPSNVARRQADKVGNVATSVKDRVMGTADDLQGSTSDLASGVGNAPHAAASRARRSTEGNPLAAGLIALGAGWLLGSLLPASEKEKRAAASLQDKAQPAVDEVKAMAKDTVSELKEPAQQAAQSVQEVAVQAKDTVVEEGRSSAEDVKSQAQDSSEKVRSAQQS
ncbi:DUF3618 domain-containing protein [Pedococcus sp. KACC 23699]|uniref:DUF3618 domain-containing protein n=1 Tax=Pedococcus sp. KACC 23699 TaxID=3149228 RepID=A0AAU7JS18_9MICO